MARTCPFGVCDGSGMVVDDELRLAAPCRCRGLIVGERRARGLSNAIPRKYQGVSFDRPPITEMPAATVQVVRALPAQPRPAPPGGPRPVALRRHRDRQDDACDARVEDGAGGGALRRDLLAAAPARRDPRHLRGGLAHQLHGPPGPARRGRPAARGRRRDREDAAPGCSSSCTRSSTPATRTAIDRSSRPTSTARRWRSRSARAPCRGSRRCARSCRSSATTIARHIEPDLRTA